MVRYSTVRHFKLEIFPTSNRLFLMFLIFESTGAVVAPAFNAPTDSLAYGILKSCFPHRKIVMVPSRDILLGGGNIHCITQQQPLP